MENKKSIIRLKREGGDETGRSQAIGPCGGAPGGRCRSRLHLPGDARRDDFTGAVQGPAERGALLLSAGQHAGLHDRSLYVPGAPGLAHLGRDRGDWRQYR